MSLRAAILGFLRLEPTSGYMLRKRFEGSVGAFWSVTQSQIYRELHALEKDGLVVSEREPGEGKPDRLVYSLSKRGMVELDAWLRAPVEPLHLRHPLLLKFVLAAELPPRVLDDVLAKYGDSLAATRAEYTARLSMKEIFSLARSKREATLWRLSIEHGLAWCDAELAWVDKARRELRPKGGRR
ncbi:PadR family transcriptional regulator [Sorangium sp. So ce145]|uniref:PadR family transcriptional regulator n=1 Tax=Sorangium sp. So ce145 TaxID=3133285 RepID=UPI003F63C69C